MFLSSWFTSSSSSSTPATRSQKLPEQHPLSSLQTPNTPEQSARARENLKQFRDTYMRTHSTVGHFKAPLKMEHMLANSANNLPELSFPLGFTPNHDGAAAHNYFHSANPEFHEVLGVLNNRIHRNPELKQTLAKTEPTNFTLKLFSKPSKGVDTAYRSMLDAYGEGLYPILSTAKDSGIEEFERRPGRVSAALKLDSLLGKEFSTTSAPRHLQDFLHTQLGFAENQLIRNHPEEQKIIQNWRVKSAARYAMQRATTINSTWGEWATSAGITTLWSFGLDILAKNAGVISLFKPELKKTNFNQLPAWRKVILGVPDKIYNRMMEAAGSNKRTGTVAIGLLGQGSAEVPDVLLVQGAIQRSGAEGETLTAWQGFKKAVATKKLATGAAVISATIGTSFEKAKELVWIPKSVGAKVGSSALGFVTNGVSVLACGLPFFSEGGSQAAEAAQQMAKTYHPKTGALKLPAADHDALILNGTVKGVKKYFEQKSAQEILHVSPTSKIVAASIPVALGVSVLPSAINAASTFLPEGLIPEIVKTTVSWLQVPAFGPIELLAMNVVAKLNKTHPQLTTNLSKFGRPVITVVHAPFSATKRAALNARSWWRSERPENPDHVYQDFLNHLTPPA